MTLNAGNNDLVLILPETLRHMSALKALVLNNNRMNKMDWLPTLSSLNSLILSHNRISVIPEKSITRLQNLSKLALCVVNFLSVKHVGHTICCRKYQTCR